ncbi:hypothetical protein F5B22DRAFT_212655 [Xylaria bambusicola]|uniref:uncharacterized protein n=1 Tax=Xylaria bambusicola TaxID=326684 RepID=UPI00200859EB|nr:uncharacterized protein F5B22DRAFT_212655 [Xylaria bambusicola]KAI0515012.1 hypothetical protein F5B22DRAFT_212655 [Xylaria bambusicola]
MPTQTRSGGKPSAGTTYRSTAAAPKQRKFPHRRQSTKTYGRRPPLGRKLKQETLTQMDFTSLTSSAMQDFVADDDEKEVEEAKQEEEEEDVEYDGDKENMELKPPKPAGKAKAKAQSRSSRRKTAGDGLDIDEVPRKSKRRKTLGDSPNPSISSSFHTQTLTQMMSSNERDRENWQIEDSEYDDENDLRLVAKTPRKSTAHSMKTGTQEGAGSAVPSLIESATPVNRQKKTEIPSSQSPATPMLLRYSPQHSPLITKSTNVTAPSPILKNHKTPRNAIIPDSYSTAHESSPISAQKSTVEATPSKKLRFELPEDKENITPGRTKPKSPKPKSQSTGRRPLQEVPDSDEELEDLDETEYETEDDEFEGPDPDSPTPRRFQNAVPLVNNLEPQLGPDIDQPELEQTPTRGSRTITGQGSAALLASEEEEHLFFLEQPNDYEPGDEDIFLEQPNVYEPGDEDIFLEQPHNYQTVDQELGQEDRTEVEVEIPNSRVERDNTNTTPASRLGGTIECTLSEQGENNATTDEAPPSQDNWFTQGLESQRLPLESIRALGPQTPHSDIMVSLHPEHIARIVDQTKNHEFRVWKIPQQVSRIWIYITRPKSQLQYMCLFSEPKTPGEIEDEGGVGNVEFNQGKMAAKFAYEILQVYELNNPVSLDEMKRKGWVAGPPQKYTYIPPAVVGELTANLRCALFGEASQLEDANHEDLSESQELKAQLQSDADYSTQQHSESTNEVIPASQSPHKNGGANSEAVVDEQGFVRPALSRVRSTSSNHESPSLPSQKHRNSIRPSQATTVSQVSSSPLISPGKLGARPVPVSSETVGSSPTLFRRTHSSLRSSQFLTPSQMLPESLLNADIHEPPPIVWDSADSGDSD